MKRYIKSYIGKRGDLTSDNTYNNLKSIAGDLWGYNSVEVTPTEVSGIWLCQTARHGGYLVDIKKHPELSQWGWDTMFNNVRAFEEDYEALKVLWVFPQLIENMSNVDSWLNKESVVRYETSSDAEKFLKLFPERNR